MSLVMRAGEITGRPVVTLDTAEDVAEVKDWSTPLTASAPPRATTSSASWPATSRSPPASDHGRAGAQSLRSSRTSWVQRRW